MGKVLSAEEQRQTLEKLKSDLVATRFMTLKYISYSLLQDKIDFSKMDMENPEFTRLLSSQIDHLAKNDAVEMVKREAAVFLENLKKKINPTLANEVPVCTSCGERLMVSYKFCSKCGSELKGQKWASSYKNCDRCGSPFDPSWNNCSMCGNLLIKKIEGPKTCLFCKKNVEPSWILCPFCGSKLKTLA